MKGIKFLVFTDLHADMIHDGVARMARIAETARKENVDFVIQLGDLCYPEEAWLRTNSPRSLQVMAEKRPWSLGRDDEKRAIRSMLKEIGRPVYHVLGNHDLHVCDKETLCRYLGIPGPYYSFCEGGYRFLALDTNLIRTRDGMLDMAYGNHGKYAEEQLKYLSGEQLEWLEDMLASSEEPCMLLSHVSLTDPLSGIHESEKLKAILKKQKSGKVILAMNGHGHVDGLRWIERVPFWDVNSASYHFLGERYSRIRYSRKLCEAYPRLRETAPYYDPLYAIAEIRSDAISIRGTFSWFVGPSPQEAGMPEEENDYPPCAEIRDRVIPRAGWTDQGKNSNREEQSGERKD